MRKFAKVFDSKDYGQLVIIQQSSDEDSKPEIRFFFLPEPFGVCNISTTFEDSDRGWEKCEESFEKMTLEIAENCVKSVFEMARED